MGAMSPETPPWKTPAWERYGVGILLVLLPFGVFWWMCPFFGPGVLGVDYGIFAPLSQMDYLAHMKVCGLFPLFRPAQSGGISMAALTMAQAYHPLPYLSAMMPGYFTGYALEWNTFWRFLSLGLAHLCLYRVLRRMGIAASIAFLGSFVAVYNHSTTANCLIYGAANENLVGYLFLVAAVMHHFLGSSRRTAVATIAGATYLATCGGFSPIAYFGLGGAAVYTLFVPFVAPALMGTARPAPRSILAFYLRVAGGVLIGLLLSAAYLLPYYDEFIRVNGGRIGQPYKWSYTRSPDSLYGVLSSFFRPQEATIFNGFGGPIAFAVAMALPLVLFVVDRLERPILLLWLWVLFGVSVTIGPYAPVHYLLWKYLPGFSSIRYPGRFAVMLPVGFMLLLAWFGRRSSSAPRSGPRFVSPLALVSLVVLVLFVAYNAVPSSELLTYGTNFTPSAMHGKAIPIRWMEGAAVATLLGLCLVTARRTWLRALAVALVLTGTFGQVVPFLHYSTHLGRKNSGKGILRYHNVVSLDTWTKTQASSQMTWFPEIEGEGVQTRALLDQQSHTTLEARLAWIGRSEVRSVASLEETYRIFDETDRTPQSLLVEGSLPPAVQDALGTEPSQPDRVRLEHGTYNEVEFQADVSAPGVFVLNYPFSGHWRAAVDGAPVAVRRANGLAQAVFLESAGTHRIRFRYISPAGTAGMLVSCLTIAGLGAYLAFGSRRRALRWGATALALGSAAGLFTLWSTHLYGGRSLGAQYAWSSDEFPKPRPDGLRNIAYGKPATMQWENIFHQIAFSAGRAVDGILSPEDRMEADVWWQVDLRRPRSIQEIVIHNQLRFTTERPMDRPVDMQVSLDGVTFDTVYTFTPPLDKGGEWTVPLAGRSARYVRLQRHSGNGILILTEVEVLAE